MTLRSAEARSSRWNCWKTKPMRRLRIAESVSSSARERSWPSKRYVPPSGRSRKPRMLRSVDLPEPDAPMIATNSPGTTRSVTPRSTSIAWPSFWYVRVRFSIAIMMPPRVARSRAALAQRRRGVQRRRALRGVQPEREPERGAGHERERERHPRHTPRGHTRERERAGSRDAEHHAHDAAGERNGERLDQELPRDVSGPRADRAAHADRVRALPGAEQHHVHDDEPAGEQCDERDADEQAGQRGRRLERGVLDVLGLAHEEVVRLAGADAVTLAQHIANALRRLRGAAGVHHLDDDLLDVRPAEQPPGRGRRGHD